MKRNYNSTLIRLIIKETKIMKHSIKSWIALILFFVSATAMAQETKSGYFTEGYLYRYSMNPALGNDKNFVSIPALGNINVGLRSNIGVDNILYNVNGKTTTFLNPNVSAAEFLKNVHDKNRIGTDVKVNVLSAGFKGFGGYNTISLNVRANVGLTVPGSLLRLAKEGPENKTYDIKDFNAHADAYVELGFGHSRQLNEQWKVGGTVKFLLGGGNVDAEFNNASLTLGEDQWMATTDAKVQTSVKGFTYKTTEKMRGAEGQEVRHTYVDDVDVDGGGPNGFGLAVDLGAEFKLNKDWTFSASLLDLGFINWNNNMVASTNGVQTFTTDRYIFNVDDNATNSFENEMDRLEEGIASLYELQDNGDQGSRTRMLGATLNLGAEYTFPLYDKLKFGLLNTTRIQGEYSWTEFRLSANVSPIKWFGAGINTAVGSYGASFGWICSIHPKGYTLFLAMDHTLGSLAKQGLPLSGKGSVSLGMNIAF